MTAIARALPRRARRRRQGEGGTRRWVVWVFPLILSLGARLLVGYQLFNYEEIIAFSLAAFALVYLVRRPSLTTGLLVGIIPYTLVLSSTLYALGLPGGVARMAALWKEAAVLAVVIAAWRRTRGQKGHFDGLDALAVAFIALGTLYMFVPELVAVAQGSNLDLDTRFVGWRLLVLPSVLLLACRRLRPSEKDLALVLRWGTWLGISLGVVAIVEFVASDWWNTFMVETIGVNRYRLEVLGIQLAANSAGPDDIRVYGDVAGREIVRVGGPMVSQLTFAFVLLIVLGVLLERVLRHDGGTPAFVGLGLCGAGLLFTQTRSAIVGGVLLLLVAFLPAPGRSGINRLRYGILAGLAAVFVLPLIFGAGLTDRFSSGDKLSENLHEAGVTRAVDTIEEHPLGLGIGMGSINNGRDVEGAIGVENQFLDTGVQMGVLGALLFIGQYAMLLLVLRRASARAGPNGRTLAFGACNAMFGLLVPFWYQAAFGLIEVSWVLFALAGFALGARAPARDPIAVP
jgi:hypothetical protein